MSDGPHARGAPGHRDDRRAYVVVLSGEAAGEVIPIDRELVVGRGRAARLRVLDEDVSRLHARLSIDDADHTVWVEDLGSRNGTLLNGRALHRARAPVSHGDRIQVGAKTLLKLAWQDWLEASFFTTMREGAMRDPRTGLFTRSYLVDRLRGELSYATHLRLPLSLLLVRVPTDALPEVARALEQHVRSEDVLARVAADELALVLRGVDDAGAQILADRVRAHGVDVSLAIDVGVAARPPLEDGEPQALLDAARASLRAK